MVGKCSGRDKRFVAATAGTAVYGRFVVLGIQVVTDVALALEAPFAVGAIGVHVAIVFLELCVVIEILFIMHFQRFICPVAENEKRD